MRGKEREVKMLEKQILAYRMPIKEECEVNKSFARHPISFVPEIEQFSERV